MAAQETMVQTRASGVKRFLREVRAELKKVSWPDKKELSAYTGVVFISVLIVGALIWGIDSLFSGALKLFFR